jgi:hypothetical protein
VAVNSWRREWLRARKCFFIIPQQFALRKPRVFSLALLHKFLESLFKMQAFDNAARRT